MFFNGYGLFKELMRRQKLPKAFMYAESTKFLMDSIEILELIHKKTHKKDIQLKNGIVNSRWRLYSSKTGLKLNGNLVAFLRAE